MFSGRNGGGELPQITQMRASPDTDLHRWGWNQSVYIRVSRSEYPCHQRFWLLGRRLATEHTERPTAVTEHTEGIWDVKYWKYNLGVGGLGFQCLLCAAKRLQCVLW